MEVEQLRPHHTPSGPLAHLFHRDRWFAYLMVGSLSYAAWAMTVGWSHTLLDVHSFRQTETAITVQYLLKGSPWLRYEMPVLGPPWSIPFEFPLYQWIVATIIWLLGTPIVQTGRFVAAGFFLLSLIPILSVQRTFGIRGWERFLLPALLCTSPLYLFWSRTFLIESTALFFSIAWLAAGARWIATGGGASNRRLLVLAVAAGVLGALVKITTFAGFAAALAAVAAWVWPRDQWRGRRFHLVIGLTALAVLPVAAGVAWTQFADAAKRLNALADGVYTSDALRSWVFGTLAQKLDWQAWILHLDRTIRYTLGHPAVVLASLVLALWIPQAYRRAYLGCLALFAIVPAIFTNLHFVHEYYPYASGLFLTAALAVCILGSLNARLPVRFGGVVLLLMTLFASIAEYRNVFYRLQTRNREPDHRLIERVHRLVGPADVVMIHGWEANPEFPYYLERRAVMDWRDRDVDSPAWTSALERLHRNGYHVRALLACHRTRSDSVQIRKAVSILGFGPQRLYSGSACDLYAGSS